MYTWFCKYIFGLWVWMLNMHIVYLGTTRGSCMHNGLGKQSFTSHSNVLPSFFFRFAHFCIMPLTQQQRSRIQQIWNANKNKAAIARVVKCTRGAVRTWCERSSTTWGGNGRGIAKGRGRKRKLNESQLPLLDIFLSKYKYEGSRRLVPRLSAWR